MVEQFVKDEYLIFVLLIYLSFLSKRKYCWREHEQKYGTIKQ